MKKKSIKNLPGVRVRRHASRKHGRRADEYYTIRYRIPGSPARTREEGVGWASDGYTAQRAFELRQQVVQAMDRMGRAYSLAELRQENELSQAQVAQEEVRARQGVVSFSQACGAYLEWAKSNKSSWKVDYYHIKNHLRPFLGGYLMADITPTLVEGFRQHLMTRTGRNQKNMAPSTINQCLLLVSRVFRQSKLLPLGDDPRVPMFVGGNPVAGVDLLQAGEARWRVVTQEQEVAILSVAKDLDVLRVAKDYSNESHALVFHDAILFALNTGARLSEVCDLTWNYVDLERGAVRLVETKNKTDRTVYPDRECLVMLRRRKSTALETHVFWDSNCSLRPVRLSRIFGRIVDHLGLNDGYARTADKLVFHSLRHTYGTRATMSGVQPLALKKLMGHKNLSTTERYVHLAEEFLQGQAEALNV